MTRKYTLGTLQEESRERHLKSEEKIDELEDRTMASILMEDLFYGRRARKKQKRTYKKRNTPVVKMKGTVDWSKIKRFATSYQ